MDKIQLEVQKLIYFERLEMLELVEEYIADVESGQADAIECLWDIKTIVLDGVVEVGEKIGMVTPIGWITKYESGTQLNPRLRVVK